MQQVMDQQIHHSRNAAPSGLAVELAHQQTEEAMESVANKLAIIGDDLSQSYELFSGSGVDFVRTKSWAVLEGWLATFVLLLKASS